MALCLVLLGVLGAIGGPSAASAQQAPNRVVIDGDMTSDDRMATLFVLNDPDFAVKAITVAGTGFASYDAGVRSALGLLAPTGYGDVPVSRGSATPLLGDNAPPRSGARRWRRCPNSACRKLAPPSRRTPPRSSSRRFRIRRSP